jgi:hypothetical protein
MIRADPIDLGLERTVRRYREELSAMAPPDLLAEAVSTMRTALRLAQELLTYEEGPPREEAHGGPGDANAATARRLPDLALR